METNFSLADTLVKLKSNSFVLNCKIPLGYAPGFPLVRMFNDKLLLQLPYWKCVVVGDKGKSQVYPIKYVITFELPNLTPVAFNNLAYDELYKRVTFDKSIAFFPSESNKGITKNEYNCLKKSTYEQYDRYINSVLLGTKYSDNDYNSFKHLLSRMIEPCHLETYSKLNTDFYNKFLR